jgi:hypothetical protein
MLPADTVKWSLVGGSTNLQLPVMKPVLFQRQVTGRVSEQLCSTFPVTTYWGISSRRGRFRFYIERGPNRDTIVDALIAAIANAENVAFYTFTALDGGSPIKVKPDPSASVDEEYQDGARIISVSLVEVA